MAFHNYVKPTDYVLPVGTTRSNFVFDSDLVSGNIPFLLEYRYGAVSSTFAGTDNATLFNRVLDHGLQSDGTRARWGSGLPFQTIGNKLAQVGPGSNGAGLCYHTAILTADADISADVMVTEAQAGLAFRFGTETRPPPNIGTGATYVTLISPTATGFGAPSNTYRGRLVGWENGSAALNFLWAGTTPIVNGVTYTLRVVVVGTTYTVYLNGVLEGSFTGLANQTAVQHMPSIGIDEGARIDNWSVAKSINPIPDTYTVRNYDGDIVTSGAISAATFNISNAALKQRNNLGPYGWYRVYITGPDHNDGQWGTAYGDCAFYRIPNSSLPVNGGLTQANGGSPGADEIARGVMGMGTSRYSMDSSIAAATQIPQVLPALQLAKTWQTDTASAARPRRVLMAFPAGTTGNEANVTQIVAGLKDYVTAWESRNEPNFTVGPDAWVLGEFTAFYNAVKAGDPNAQVLGPGNVSFNDGQISYVDRFIAAGGGNVSDGFSLHPYNCYNGDLATTRYTLGKALALIAAGGLSNRDIWMTEQGFGWNYGGVVWPHYATRWTSLMYFAQECITHGKMRPETTAYWYDTDLGFDDFPMFWLTDGGPGPTVGPIRTYSAEVYGKTFTSELDFGTYAKNVYVGGVWTDAGTGNKVVGAMASSYGCNDIRFAVTGSTTFTHVDPWGNTQTLTASGGVVTFPISELPTWLRVPAGTTAALIPGDWSWGTNIALTSSPSFSGTQWGPFSGTVYSDPALIINDIHENHQAKSQPSPADGLVGIDQTFPQTVTLTFGSSTINRVVVFCHSPWHEFGTLVDFDLQTFDGSTWTTRRTWTGDVTRSFHFTSGVARCKVESYWNDQYIFEWKAPSPVTCQGARLWIRNTAYTGFDTKDTSDTGSNGQNGFGYWITIREFQVFSASPSTGLAPRLRNPAMGGVI